MLSLKQTGEHTQRRQMTDWKVSRKYTLNEIRSKESEKL